MASVLTTRSVASAKPDINRREIPDAGLPGLYLVVQPSGQKSWALRYRFGGKPKKLTLGSVLLERLDPAEEAPTIGIPLTLSEARQVARQAMQMIAEGRDPSEAKKAAVALKADPDAGSKNTIEFQSKRFVERYCKPKNRSWEEVQRQFNVEINSVLGQRDITLVSKSDLIGLLDAIVDRGSGVTANRVLATLKTFFGWLHDRDLINTDPSSGLKKPTLEKSRERVLTDNEIRLIWKATAFYEGPFSSLWRLLLLTGQRRNEVAGAQWGELDLKSSASSWTIPGSRTKNGKTHKIPLPAEVVRIFEQLPRIGLKPQFCFTTTGSTPISGFSRTKSALDRRILSIAKTEAVDAGRDPTDIIIAPWTLHDLRRTMATGMARLGVGLPVIEKCLNHSSGSFGGIVGVYQHHDYFDEMKTAFELWVDFIEKIAHKKPELL